MQLTADRDRLLQALNAVAPGISVEHDCNHAHVIVYNPVKSNDDLQNQVSLDLCRVITQQHGGTIKIEKNKVIVSVPYGL